LIINLGAKIALIDKDLFKFWLIDFEKDENKERGLLQLVNYLFLLEYNKSEFNFYEEDNFKIT
jgi:predicted Ser/Thr protein kinase